MHAVKFGFITIAILTATALYSGCQSCSCSDGPTEKKQRITVEGPADWTKSYKDNVELRNPDAEACTKLWNKCYGTCLRKFKGTKKEVEKRCYKTCYARTLVAAECSRYRNKEERQKVRNNSPYQELDPRNIDRMKQNGEE